MHLLRFVRLAVGLIGIFSLIFRICVSAALVLSPTIFTESPAVSSLMISVVSSAVTGISV